MVINQFKNKIDELTVNEEIKNIDQETFSLDKTFNKRFNLFTMIVENETRINKINHDFEEKYEVVERVEKVKNTYLFCSNKIQQNLSILKYFTFSL